MPRYYLNQGSEAEIFWLEKECVEDVICKVSLNEMKLNPAQSQKDFYVAYCFTCGHLRDAINALNHFNLLATESRNNSANYDENVLSSFINPSVWGLIAPKSVFASIEGPVEHICCDLDRNIDMFIDALFVLLQVMIKKHDDTFTCDIMFSDEVSKKDLAKWIKYQQKAFDENTLALRLIRKIMVQDEFDFPMCESAYLVSTTIAEMVHEMPRTRRGNLSLAKKRCKNFYLLEKYGLIVYKETRNERIDI